MKNKLIIDYVKTYRSKRREEEFETYYKGKVFKNKKKYQRKNKHKKNTDISNQ